MLALIMAVSSQCVIMGMLAVANIWSRVCFLSTSILPVDEPIKSFIPGTMCGSRLENWAILSLVAPKKKE